MKLSNTTPILSKGVAWGGVHQLVRLSDTTLLLSKGVVQGGVSVTHHCSCSHQSWLALPQAIYIPPGPASPQCPGVILLLKDTGPAVDDNAIGVHLILHVGGVGGAVQREQERAIRHPGRGGEGRGGEGRGGEGRGRGGGGGGEGRGGEWRGGDFSDM